MPVPADSCGRDDRGEGDGVLQLPSGALLTAGRMLGRARTLAAALAACMPAPMSWSSTTPPTRTCCTP
jgi:hypothetical protein